MHATSMALETRATPVPVVASYNVVMISCFEPSYVYQTLMALVFIAAVMPLGNYPSELSPAFVYLFLLNILMPDSRLLEANLAAASVPSAVLEIGHRCSQEERQFEVLNNLFAGSVGPNVATALWVW